MTLFGLNTRDAAAHAHRFCIAMAMVCGTIQTLAYAHPAGHVAAADHVDEGLPTFDIRLDAQGEPIGVILESLARHVQARDAAYAKALGRLQLYRADAQVDGDPFWGTPSDVRAWSGFLSDRNPGEAPAAVVAKFIGDYEGLFEINAGEVALARKTRDFVTEHNGVTHLTYQQQIGGVDLFDAGIKANVSKDGELINISSTMLTRPAGDFRPADAVLSDLQAIRAAAASVGIVMSGDPTVAEQAVGASRKRKWNNTADFRADRAIATERVYFPMTREEIRPAWLVTIPMKGVGHTYNIVIDAIDAKVLHRVNELRFEVSTFRVYTGRSPIPRSATTLPYPFASRSLVQVNSANTGPGSPFGWFDTNGVAGPEFTNTRGNNVDAHLDLNADNIADAPRPDGGASLLFQFVQDNAAAPSAYRDAAVTQAFYLANVYHDKLYSLGFTEAAGNFQVNNYGRGGAENDSVQMDVQDGSATNNANFSTPADGVSGRCQMYVWTAPTPDRDGALDADVVYHELTHGLSNRLTGGPANSSALNAAQSFGLGEGWSDFFACCLSSVPGEDPATPVAFASFSTDNYTRGIRRFAYSTNMTTNPLTWDAYGSSGTTSYGVARSTLEHNTGEIWCATLWECRAGLMEIYGFAANDMMMRLVCDGMKLQPANPSFSQARDAILAADLTLNGGANQLILWRAFAKRGLGASFSTPNSSSTLTPILGFDLPAYAENADASELPGTARVVLGTGALTRISGTFASTNDVDMYRISVCNTSTFSASTVGGTNQNTQLFLFDANGVGVEFNDDSGATTQSMLTNQFVTTSGDYYLAVSLSDRDPSSSVGPIWLDTPLGTQRQPDGPGAGAGRVVTSWSGTGVLTTPTTYTIALTGACAASVQNTPLAPLAMSAFGSPTPSVVNFLVTPANVVFKAYVNLATLPASTGITVSLNASAIGLGTVSLLDGGVAPDTTSGDRIFTAQRAVSGVAVGIYDLPYRVTDAQGRVFDGTMQFSVIDAPGTCCLPGGGCSFLTSVACSAVSGTYKGADIPCEASVCNASFETEPNNSLATTNDASRSFSAYTGNIFHMGIRGNLPTTTDADYFNIGALQAGDVITITQSGSATLSGTSTDPLVRLYRNNGGTIALMASDDDSGPGLDSVIWRYTVATADTYFAVALRAGTNSTGTYRMGFNLENTGALPATGSSFTAEVEPNDTAITANNASNAWRPVQYISTLLGSMAPGDSDYFAYSFTAGDLVSLRTYVSTGLTTRLNLLNSAGATLTFEDGTSVGPGGQAPIVAYIIPSTGTYYINALPVSGSGSYALVVRLSTNTPPPQDLCAADFNQDGGVDGADVTDFFAAWESGDGSADVNQDGGVDGADVSVFFAAWEAGGC